jgi:ADP-ribosylglycohydrolase
MDADRFHASLLLGAIGDALGAPIEFLSMEIVYRVHGPDGITTFEEEYGGRGKITDDTQMTLFTLEGLIRGHHAMRTGSLANPLPAVAQAYLRWLYTQGQRNETPFDGWLIQVPGLHSTRAPGNTCITSLRGLNDGKPIGTFTNRLNTSKGCGAVMRCAPFAIWSENVNEVFTLASAAGAITHSHPSGYLSGGTLAVIVHRLVRGDSLDRAVAIARAELSTWDGHEEQLAIVDKAMALGRPTPESIAADLGGGWVGEEALAIALLAARTGDNVRDALLLAANHSGDTDSTAAICGNILGAAHGTAAIPPDWLDEVELRDVVDQLAADALQEFSPTPPDTDDWRKRYPAHP